MLKRLKAASRTNATQCETVLMLSAVNGLAAIGGDSWALVVGAILFWPLIAFAGNLLHPIP